MLLAINCNDPGLAAFFMIAKNMLNLIRILGPILCMISLAFTLFKMMQNPDEKKNPKKIYNTLVATAVLFFVPTIVFALVGMVDENTPIGSCWKNASTTRSTPGTYVPPHTNKKQPSTIYTDPKDYQKGTPKQEGNTQGEGNSAANKVIFIGDSRTVQMYAYLNNDWAGANYSSGGVHEVGSDVYVAQGGMGLNWMRSTGIPAAQKYFGSGSAIVILMGVNDLSNVNNYINYVNNNASSWKSTGSSLYFVSVNPCSGSYSHMNSGINNFNSTVKAGLTNTVGWIETANTLTTEGFTATDGLHYDKATYQKIYNIIKSSV